MYTQIVLLFDNLNESRQMKTRERERKNVCVLFFLCMIDFSEREKERMCVFFRERERERENMCFIFFIYMYD